MEMQPGKYFIGDLCYVMHPEWDEVCDLMFGPDGRGSGDGKFTLKDGREFATFGTAYGDGTYHSNRGTEHCVDSGSIGCIRVEDIKDDTYDDLEDLGAIVEFDRPFRVYEDDGVIHFGHVKIYTDRWDEEDVD